MKPRLSLVTEACSDGRTALMTDRITVGEDASGRDVEVYVADAYDNDDPAEIVVTANDDDPTEDGHWGALAVTDPAVARRLADTLTAAALVLEQLQNGDLP